jgi:hypothetical protein
MDEEMEKAMRNIAKEEIEQLAKPFQELQKQLQKSFEPLLKALQERLKLPEFAISRTPELVELKIPPDPNLASEYYKRLVTWINEFDKSLDQEHEVGVRLVNFGQAVTFHLSDMGFWDPSLISLKGFTESGEPVELIQHITQISILLMKVKRQHPNKPKRPIGFAPYPDEGKKDV